MCGIKLKISVSLQKKLFFYKKNDLILYKFLKKKNNRLLTGIFEISQAFKKLIKNN